jgi:Flp pilus assembly protein TadD
MMTGINVRRVTGLVLLWCCFTLTSFVQSGNADVAAIISSLRARQYATALQVLAPAIEQNPNDPQLRSLQGIAFAGQGHSPEALAAFHRALALSPDYLPALEGAAQNPRAAHVAALGWAGKLSA